MSRIPVAVKNGTAGTVVFQWRSSREDPVIASEPVSNEGVIQLPPGTEVPLDASDGVTLTGVLNAEAVRVNSVTDAGRTVQVPETGCEIVVSTNGSMTLRDSAQYAFLPASSISSSSSPASGNRTFTNQTSTRTAMVYGTVGRTAVPPYIVSPGGSITFAEGTPLALTVATSECPFHISAASIVLFTSEGGVFPLVKCAPFSLRGIPAQAVVGSITRLVFEQAGVDPDAVSTKGVCAVVTLPVVKEATLGLIAAVAVLSVVVAVAVILLILAGMQAKTAGTPFLLKTGTSKTSKKMLK
jgi:hypothetical protein